MSKISDLAKRGIYYTPLATTAPEQQAEEDGDFVRGLKKAGHQIPQTAGGAVALVGDLVGSDGMREYGMDVYQKRADAIEKISKPTDSLSSVLEGEEGTSAVDWAQNAAGYVTGQVGTALVTGGVGGFIGKQLAKRGIQHIVERGATSAAAKQVAEKVATRGARAGALSGIMGLNLMQEAGSIYPDAVHVAESEGRELTGADKARVVGSSIAAAGVDTAMDALMLGRVMAGGRRAGEGMAKAAARELPLAMGREGVTEGIQTGIERYGAGKELSTADAVREYVDSIGVGMVGGGMGGALSVLHSQKVPDAGPLSRAANTAIDQEILALTNDPDPMVGFPDGSVGTKAQVEAYLKQFPEENGARNEARAKLLGLDGKTGEPLEPEPVEAPPEPEFAATPEEQQSKLNAWAAEHEPATLDYAHSLLAAPGMKGKNMMVAPHPDGGGYTVVPSNWLTLDTQATLGELQKPAPKAKEGEKAEAKPEPQSAPQNIPENIPAPAAGPVEPEWKTNPYTAYKFGDAARAEQFMVNKKADPALFEVQPAGYLFVIKRKPTQGESNEAGLAAVHPDGSAGRDSSSGIAAGPERADELGTGPVDAANEQPAAAVGIADQAAEPDPVHATGSADADAALKRHPVKITKARGSKSADVSRTLESLPPVADGHTRLFRAESPTVKFDDVFNAEGLADFKTDLPGARYTTDLNYANYYRQSYGPDAAIHYVDVPNAMAEKGRLSDDEYVIEEPANVPEPAKVPEEATAAQSAQGEAPAADPALISEAAHEAATSPLNTLAEPTPAQAKAGNYKKGRVKLHGLDFAIENPAGSVRKGVSPDGKAWENKLEHHYGDISGSKGADGDAVDAFIGPNPASDRVFVVDQIDPATGKFDEHKALFGFDSLEEARAGYAANYEAGWQGGKDVSETSVAGFKAWLNEGDTTKPFAQQVAPTAVDPASTAARDTGEGIPKAFYKKVKVSHDVHVEETGAVEPTEIPADKALASVREDIANLQALLKCMKGGA